MRTSLAFLLAAASLLGTAMAQLSIVTPLQWSGGVGAVVRTADSSQVISFGSLNNNSITWRVTEPPGTSLEFVIRDSQGTPQNSAPWIVGTGDPSLCPSSSGSSSSGSSKPTSSGSSKSISTSASTSASRSVSTSTSITTTTTTSTSAVVPPPTSSAPIPSSTAPGSSSGSTAPSSASSAGTSPSSTPPPSGAVATTAFPGVAIAAVFGAALLAAVL
ncbi:hypothetical protein FB45DRAFT_927540 [Roridomyces roridus]|uniref:Uncharacterized protein n=1 Tax=Roridomyces roridus TaxID=1738132 RepID=A0AAD7FG73_9AGAR|nr:hypothetical protein FB45DRAFT_927540 [Roridomyces roridus]